MFKKIATIAGFIIIFSLAAATIFYLQNTATSTTETSQSLTQLSDTNQIHSYTAENLQAACSSEDSIFCAVERTVKCTIKPELEDCDKKYVPAFVIGKIIDTERPTEISFKITKIKPVPESDNISVYTQSNCNALWFGLCKGTVVYTMHPEDSNWAVTNIFALEE